MKRSLNNLRFELIDEMKTFMHKRKNGHGIHHESRDGV